MDNLKSDKNFNKSRKSPLETKWKPWKVTMYIPELYKNTSVYKNILIFGGISTIPLIIITVVRIIYGLKIPDMTMDIAAIAGIHPLSGFLSSLGILLWWTSASIWLFTAYIKRKKEITASIGFQLYSGILSLYIALDDLFQFHEHIAEKYLNISEHVIYILLLTIILFYIRKYNYVFQRSDGAFLGMALFFLASSVFVDAVLEPLLLYLIKNWEYLIEDGLKWLGICFWTGFCVKWCTKDLILSMSKDEFNSKLKRRNKVRL